GLEPSVAELTQRFPERVTELVPLLDPAGARSAILGRSTDGSLTDDVISRPAASAGATLFDPSEQTADVLSQVGRAGRAGLGGYELRERGGRGGFATVFRAWDLELRRDVAIKIPRAELTENSASHARVLREARSAAQLRHPAIVPIHQVGEAAGS